MEGFYLLCAHLLGDYILQNDWQAANKANPWPGKRPGSVKMPNGSPVIPSDLGDQLLMWDAGMRRWWVGNFYCTVHCLLYTLAVAAFSFWWMPWWGYVACFVAHWGIDRFRLAGRWMRNFSGQAAFASGPLAPWSVIVVDNTIHLLTLAAIAAVAGR